VCRSCSLSCTNGKGHPQLVGLFQAKARPTLAIRGAVGQVFLAAQRVLPYRDTVSSRQIDVAHPGAHSGRSAPAGVSKAAGRDDTVVRPARGRRNLDVLLSDPPGRGGIDRQSRLCVNEGFPNGDRVVLFEEQRARTRVGSRPVPGSGRRSKRLCWIPQLQFRAGPDGAKADDACHDHERPGAESGQTRPGWRRLELVQASGEEEHALVRGFFFFWTPGTTAAGRSFSLDRLARSQLGVFAGWARAMGTRIAGENRAKPSFHHQHRTRSDGFSRTWLT